MLMKNDGFFHTLILVTKGVTISSSSLNYGPSDCRKTL